MPKKHAMGRPSGFNKCIAERILELAKTGATEVQIAAKVGISPTTLANWKGKHPDFLKALKEAKNVADELVEASLFERACGYSHPAVKFFWDRDSKKVVSQAYIERHAPDVTACIFWLKNRRPDKWRDAHRQELTGKDGAPLEGAVPPQVVITLPDNGRSAKE